MKIVNQMPFRTETGIIIRIIKYLIYIYIMRKVKKLINEKREEKDF